MAVQNKKKKTGQYATGEEVLSYLAHEHQIVRAILEWRQLIKLQSTYVDALPNQVNPKQIEFILIICKLLLLQDV